MLSACIYCANVLQRAGLAADSQCLMRHSGLSCRAWDAVWPPPTILLSLKCSACRLCQQQSHLQSRQLTWASGWASRPQLQQSPLHHKLMHGPATVPAGPCHSRHPCSPEGRPAEQARGRDQASHGLAAAGDNHVHVFVVMLCFAGRPALTSYRLLLGYVIRVHVPWKGSLPGKVLDTCSITCSSITVHSWVLRCQSALCLPKCTGTSTEVVCVQVASQNKARAQELALQEAAACAASGKQAVVLQVRPGAC